MAASRWRDLQTSRLLRAVQTSSSLQGPSRGQSRNTWTKECSGKENVFHFCSFQGCLSHALAKLTRRHWTRRGTYGWSQRGLSLRAQGRVENWIQSLSSAFSLSVCPFCVSFLSPLPVCSRLCIPASVLIRMFPALHRFVLDLVFAVLFHLFCLLFLAF